MIWTLLLTLTAFACIVLWHLGATHEDLSDFGSDPFKEDEHED